MIGRGVALSLVATLTLPVFLARGQILIRELRVDGNSRLKESAVISASGLRINTEVSRADLGAKVVVATTIDEGPIWRLGKVTVDGEDLAVHKALAAGNFAAGQVANWKAFMAGVENMNTVLKHQGFIGVSSTPVRTFQASGGVVDVTVKVRKGLQYRFASLEVTGLTDSEHGRALRLWKLQVGQPMDGPYIDEYMKEIFDKIRPSKTSVSAGMQIPEGTDQVGVVIAFK